MSEIVYNVGYGGFSLSKEAVKYMAEKGSKEAIEMLSLLSEEPAFRNEKISHLRDDDNFGPFVQDNYRYDPFLIDAVKTLTFRFETPALRIEEIGEKANGKHSHLYIKKIKGNKFRIIEYDGNEDVETPDTILWNVIKN